MRRALRLPQMSRAAIRLVCIEQNIDLPRGRWDWVPFFGYRAVRRRAMALLNRGVRARPLGVAP
jgi:hypothetical protein